MAKIGQWNTLMAIEIADRGLMLDGGPHGLILCPTKYLPEDAEPGEEFRVFVYLDSEDRLIATTEEPLAQVGEFAFLEVVSVNPRIGAFLNWGLAKDLLLPFGEQLGRARVGQKLVVAILIDDRTGRIIASQRTHRQLDKSRPLYDDGQAVSLFIAEKTPLGYNAFINHRHLGLLYHSDLASPLEIGQTVEGFVRRVWPDDRIDLSLDASGYERVASLTDDILEALRNNDGHLEIGDKSSPEEIRRVFGASKKAYKQALGALYKKRLIRFEKDSVHLVES
ncbi:MAG: GntR family transcriptional regulator [Verrucomicrobiae bacterium]|nr:GntR family transcriptional regulator [Verrucomicrobiae bacterium]